MRIHTNDFDKIKSLQAHGYGVQEAASITGWSNSTISRIFRSDSLEDYQNFGKLSSGPNKQLDLGEEVSDEVSLIAAIKQLGEELVENTKSNYVLRRDLVNAIDSIFNLLSKVLPPEEVEEEDAES